MTSASNDPNDLNTAASWQSINPATYTDLKVFFMERMNEEYAPLVGDTRAIPSVFTIERMSDWIVEQIAPLTSAAMPRAMALDFINDDPSFLDDSVSERASTILEAVSDDVTVALQYDLEDLALTLRRQHEEILASIAHA